MADLITLEALGDGVTRLMINRPDRMNSLIRPLFRELRAAVRTVERDGTRALIVTGAGERAFCAGYDLGAITELREVSIPEFIALEDEASASFAAIHRLPIPVLAAINGAASGGGLSLALACDLRVAASTAKLNAAFVRVGLSAGELGTSWMLSRVVGPGMAAELTFTARMVEAAEAYRIGLVDRVVAPEELAEETVALARELASPDRSLSDRSRIGKRTFLHTDEVASYDMALQGTLPDRA